MDFKDSRALFKRYQIRFAIWLLRRGRVMDF